MRLGSGFSPLGIGCGGWGLCWRCMDLHCLAVARSALEGVRRYSVGDACIVLWVSDNKQGVRTWVGVETLNASIF